MPKRPRRLTLAQVIARLDAAADRKHGGLYGLAHEWEMTAPYLYQIRSGTRPPSDKVLEKLGLRRVVTEHFEEVKK